jgi:hypothetical protein
MSCKHDLGGQSAPPNISKNQLRRSNALDLDTGRYQQFDRKLSFPVYLVTSTSRNSKLAYTIIVKPGLDDRTSQKYPSDDM